jgi:hypothetical protein
MYEDKIFALEAEVDDLKLELVNMEEAGNKGDAFAETIKRAQ